MEQGSGRQWDGFHRFDDKLVQSGHLNFVDKGYIAPKRKTRKFAVISRFDQSLLGYVQWFAHWRQYVFFPLNCILNKDCLREAADYCDEVTTAHKESRQSFPAIG